MTAFDDRIVFHAPERVVEIDLTDLSLNSNQDVDALYDSVNQRLKATERKWFFLINYLNCRIAPEAWLQFAYRGKLLNEATSLGSVRFNTTDQVRAEIEDRADRERFAANLMRNREAAWGEVTRLRDDYLRLYPDLAPIEPALAAEFARRISFAPLEEIMEVDLSAFRFVDARIVNGFYDAVEAKIAASGRERWYFLINYRDCAVQPEAWVAFAHRGKKLNLKHALGSARYAATEQTQTAITEKANAERFDANLFPNREAARAALATLRNSARGQAS